MFLVRKRPSFFREYCAENEWVYVCIYMCTHIYLLHKGKVKNDLSLSDSSGTFTGL